jgi:hypothetical protein
VKAGIAETAVRVEIEFDGGSIRRLTGKAADQWLQDASDLSGMHSNCLRRSDWEHARRPSSLEPALIGMMRGDRPEVYLFWGNDVSWYIQIDSARNVVDDVEAGLRALAGAT